MKHNYIKRLLVLLFALIFVFPFSASNSFASESVFSKTAVAGTAEEMLTAVYAFGEYKISLRNAEYVSGGKDDGKMLTDRKYTLANPRRTHEKTEGWVMIKSYDDVSDFRATITVDFGFIAKDVKRFYIRTFRSSELLAEMPERIRFYISDNGNDFEYMGDGSTLTDITVDNSAAVYSLSLKSGVSARYMKVVIDCKGGSNALWINEVGAAAVGNHFIANDDGNGSFTDSQGIIYRIIDGYAEIVGFNNRVDSIYGELKPSQLSFNENNKTYKLGIGSDNEVTVISDFISENRQNYSGVPNNIKYIVIHNTGTVESNTDAERYNHRMHATTDESSWHYTVDENIIYHSLPDSIVGWHAGSSHNYESIGIEICVNGAPAKSSGSFIFSGSAYENWVENHFKKTLRNSAVLVAELLTRYGLSLDAVIQHYDVTEKNCPQWLREKNGKFVHDGTLWLEFLGYVEEYYNLINNNADKPIVNRSTKIIIPDYISVNGGDVYPVKAIGLDAFVGKDGDIFEIKLGKMVEKIAEGCFDGSDSIERITVSENGYFEIDSNGALTDKSGNIIFDPNSTTSIIPNPKIDCTLNIKNIENRYYLFINNSPLRLSEISDNYGAETAKAFDLNGRILNSNDLIGTGSVLNLGGARIYAVIRGDANGDAIIDQYDYILAKRTYFNNYSPTKSQFLATAITDSKTVKVYDFILIKRHYMGTLDLTKY